MGSSVRKPARAVGTSVQRVGGAGWTPGANFTGDLDDLLGPPAGLPDPDARIRPAPGGQLRGLGGDGAGDRPAAGRPAADPVRRLLGRAGDLPSAAGRRSRADGRCSRSPTRARTCCGWPPTRPRRSPRPARRRPSGSSPRRAPRPTPGCARPTQIKEMAVASADELQEQARRERAEATAHLERRAQEAAELLLRRRGRAGAAGRRGGAGAGPDRRGGCGPAGRRPGRGGRPPAPAGRGAAVAARADRPIGEALQAVAATVPDDMRGTNAAVEGMGVENVRVLVGAGCRPPPDAGRPGEAVQPGAPGLVRGLPGRVGRYEEAAVEEVREVVQVDGGIVVGHDGSKCAQEALIWAGAPGLPGRPRPPRRAVLGDDDRAPAAAPGRRATSRRWSTGRRPSSTS